MRLRTLPTLLLTALLVLIPAAVAMAKGDNGEGLAGETDDKLITFFALGVLVFFTLVVIVGSAIQGALEKRKQERKAAEMRQRVGW